ncbi:glutamate 5-kinase [Alicyclobacillus macrosporangiidus]|jgi:glutamate 5-kinase|uniref:Glutamate 5-kinase n=1 Tax=Alicyclobacillus macrosporangiidus TaxID=392015 RepID=A0A1I7K0J8_9BACL|nr:glutamate 5-kinase [Alicyclobacillus macrosporangiidus]SFU90996.1 glutamate 5-kinase [Alicyclobacillus macrosporangiidus]
MRAAKMVVKIGSSSLTDASGKVDEHRLARLVGEVHRVREAGWQVVLVSSGAVAAGVGRLGWRRAHLTMPEKQAAAAVGQGLLIGMYETVFARFGVPVGQVLLSRADIQSRRRFIHIRNTLTTLLARGVVPIVNENDTVAVEEIRFGDNDTLAALVALVVEADRLVLLTDTDGLYTADPRTHADARRIDHVREWTPDLERMAGGSGSAVGTGGMRTKLAAARIAVEAGIPALVAASGAEDILLRAARGEPVGTWFHPQPSRLPAKKLWMAHGTKVEGALILDDGAVRAITEQAASLLFPGVAAVEGEFREGAVVACKTMEGRVIAKGMVHLSSGDLRVLLERRAAGRPVHVDHEVVHRDQLVLTDADAVAKVTTGH